MRSPHRDPEPIDSASTRGVTTADLAFVLDAAPLAISMHDERLGILFENAGHRVFNPAGASSLGALSERVHPADADYVAEVIANGIAREQTWEVECRAVNGGQGTIAVTLLVDGEERGQLPAVPMLIGMAPFEGIDVGIDRRSPVSWDLWERHRTFPYTGGLRSVTVTPGELAPSNGLRWIDFLKQQAARFE